MARQHHLKKTHAGVIIPDGVGLQIGSVTTLPTASVAWFKRLLADADGIWACQSDGAGGYVWVLIEPAGGGGAGTPGGLITQIQYNDGAGNFGGDASLIWDKTNNRLGIDTGAPDYTLDVVGTESLPVATTSIGIAGLYNIGGADASTHIASIYANDVRSGLVVARKYTTAGGLNCPTSAFTAHIEAGHATGDGCAVHGHAKATVNSAVVFGSNLIATDAGVTDAKLVGLEIDIEPSAGNQPNSSSAGLYLNVFNRDNVGPAIQLGGISGTWTDGIVINKVGTTHVGLGVQSGASTMAYGVHLNNGTYGTAAATMGAQNDVPALILNRGIAAATANVFEVRDTAAHAWMKVTGSGVPVFMSKATTDMNVVVDVTSIGQNSGIIIRSAGVDKWGVLKNSSDDFVIYNAALTTTALTVAGASNAITVANLAGVGNRVVLASAAGLLSAPAAASVISALGLDADIATLSLPASTTISAFGATIIDDANAAATIATLGLDADIATLALPASTTISATGASLIDDASTAAMIATLGLDADLQTFALPASTTISATGASLIDDASTAAMIATLGLDADLQTFALPASTTISATGASLVDDASTLAMLTTLGLDNDLQTLSLPASTTISATGASLIDDASTLAMLTTLGLDNDLQTLSLPASTTISAFGATLVDDADAATARTTLGLVAAGAGDIWVEKAGDTMTGALTLQNSVAPMQTLEKYGNDTTGIRLDFSKTRNVAAGVHTVVQSGDQLMNLSARGSDGAAYVEAAKIRVLVDGTPGSNDMPGRIQFEVSPDGSATTAEALRISNDKTLTVANLAGTGTRLVSASSTGVLATSNLPVTGTTTVDFGAFPGKSDTSVTVIGQADIVAGSVVEAWIRPVATADHSVDEHLVETIKVLAHTIVAGTGFTISAFNTSQITDRGTDFDPQALPSAAPMLYGSWTVAWRYN